MRDYWRDHGTECYYCGEYPATTEDHIWPKVIGGGLGDKVPACVDCNSTLSSRHPHSHILRMKELFDRLRDRYADVLGGAPWAREELTEHEGMLRAFLGKAEHERQVALSRINHVWERIRETVGNQYQLDIGETEVVDYNIDPRARLDDCDDDD